MDSVIKILIVDDHPIVRDGLEHILHKEEDMHICAYAEDAETAIAAINEHTPDIAIVDISLKGEKSGLELTKKIHSLYPKLPVLILSMHDESTYAQRVIRLGARGYIMKHEMTSAIVQAIRKVIDGDIYLSNKMTSRFLDDLMFEQSRNVKSNVEKLTNRELEVFRLMGEGKMTSEIAETLAVSVKTIDTHRLRIKEKLNLKNSSELIKYAVEWANQNS
jgi:DNA-binding NarL/FixJ family response regulator